jgi:hypothetical protein
LRKWTATGDPFFALAREIAQIFRMDILASDRINRTGLFTRLAH